MKVVKTSDKSIIYDCQANFNFLPPSLIVDMRRAKFLCKIFTMESYDYSVIMKQFQNRLRVPVPYLWSLL